MMLAVAGTLGMSAALVAIPGTAQAAACEGQVRYASSTNTIYLQSGTATLTDVKALCASAPLTLTSPAQRIWQLDADLVIQNGATLVLHGGAVEGDVDVLRLRSLPSSSKTEVSAITAMYGNIDIDTVQVTSWDPAALGPDTDPVLPSGAATDARGRSFIRALSYMDGSTPRESRMDIANSDLGYLGWYGAESYGVAYKGRGCDAQNIPVCDALSVYGSQTNSRFHDGYMGTYTYNASDMVFTGNEYDHNVMYGLDPHDDSDFLTITYNHFHDNGDHGVICSQRCNDLVIANNESDHNGIPPFAFPGDEDISDNQIHGIMLHRGVTNTVVENNFVHDHPNGAGIAVFDSVGNTVQNNTIDGAKYGLRYSVGTTGVQTLNNTVTDSGQYAVFTYKGSDLPTYSTMTGRPTNLYFSGNTFEDTTSNALKINDADGTTFAGNTLTGTVGSVRMQNSTATTFDGFTYPASQLFATLGSPETTSSTTIAGATVPTKVSVDTNSGVTLTNTDRRVYDLAGTVATALTPTAGTLALTSATVGTGTVTITPRALWVTPSGGEATARVTSFTSSTTHVFASVSVPLTTLTVNIGARTPNTSYQIKQGSTVLATQTSNAAGEVVFTFTPSSTSVVDYTIAPGS